VMRGNIIEPNVEVMGSLGSVHHVVVRAVQLEAVPVEPFLCVRCERAKQQGDANDKPDHGSHGRHPSLFARAGRGITTPQPSSNRIVAHLLSHPMHAS